MDACFYGGKFLFCRKGDTSTAPIYATAYVGSGWQHLSIQLVFLFVLHAYSMLIEAMPHHGWQFITLSAGRGWTGAVRRQ